MNYCIMMFRSCLNLVVNWWYDPVCFIVNKINNLWYDCNELTSFKIICEGGMGHFHDIQIVEINNKIKCNFVNSSFPKIVT